MSEPDAPEQGQIPRDLAAMRKQTRDLNEVQFAISEFERAEILLNEYLTTVLGSYAGALPDLPRAQLETKLTEDILMTQEVARTVHQRSRVLIELAHKLTQHSPSGTGA